MKKIITDLYDGLSGSLHNGSEGWSGKKLSAMTLVGCIVAAHIKWFHMPEADFVSQLFSVLSADFAFVLALYGVNVADKKLNKTDEKPS